MNLTTKTIGFLLHARRGCRVSLCDGLFVATRTACSIQPVETGNFLSRIRIPWASSMIPMPQCVHQRVPGSLIHEGDFFAWAARTNERFECAAGNPPFIRYQRFSGEVRRQAYRTSRRMVRLHGPHLLLGPIPGRDAHGAQAGRSHGLCRPGGDRARSLTLNRS